MIILTLFTFMEGFQTVFMRWLAGHSMKMHTAVFMQMLLSGGLAAVLLLTLHFVSKRYAYTGRQKLSAYMYPLLLPCSFIVWVIRSGLGLDMWMEPAVRKSSFWEKRQGLWALIWILGACVIFFIILRLVSRILALSVQETEQKRLEDAGANLERFTAQMEAEDRRHTELDRLKKALSEYAVLQEQYEKSQKAYRLSAKKAAEHQQVYLSLNQAFLDGQAGILAEHLTEGLPCPALNFIS